MLLTNNDWRFSDSEYLGKFFFLIFGVATNSWLVSKYTVGSFINSRAQGHRDLQQGELFFSSSHADTLTVIIRSEIPSPIDLCKVSSRILLKFSKTHPTYTESFLIRAFKPIEKEKERSQVHLLCPRYILFYWITISLLILENLQTLGPQKQPRRRICVIHKYLLYATYFP